MAGSSSGLGGQDGRGLVRQRIRRDGTDADLDARLVRLRELA